jgi:tetratricopeptide (TPR) repeat protein
VAGPVQPESTRVTEPEVDFKLALSQARSLHSQGKFADAEKGYRELLRRAGPREPVLRALVELFLQTRRVSEAIDALVALTDEVPDSLYYYARLSVLLDGLDQPEAAITHYERLLKRQPGMAAAHFNVALLYKKAKRYRDALAAYGAAVRLGIDQVEEVYSNMGVTNSEMRRSGEAQEMYQRALLRNPDYIPALFNLGGLLEERGERKEAIALYERALAINPRNWDSLARLAHARRVTPADGELIDRLRQGLEVAGDDRSARETLYFALGKAMDDLDRFDEAFKAYRVANELGKLRHPPYDPRATEQAIGNLIHCIDGKWIRAAATGLTAAPVFVCGMFRSGSSLVEQILASHPLVAAGGELDFLPWLVARKLAPYPERATKATAEELEDLANGYLVMLRDLFPEAKVITDKQPENFLRLGLIRALFPRARLVYTKRNLPDNCLSIYFQQFDAHLSYATDLQHTGHYYRQHERLMAHWLDCFGDSVHTVDYDDLVQSPEPVLRALLDFLGLEWDERCLEFQRTGALVKTASVWQVRENLHSRSSGRWRNYATHLGSLTATAAADGLAHHRPGGTGENEGH